MSTHPSQEFHIEIQPSIREIGEKEWDRCAGNAPPFLRYAFFSGLEDSGCLNEESGWQPAYLCVKQGDRIIAVCPSFLKYNSEGEFVFDHGWAAAAEQQLGIPYFPKLVLACPFTPATGDKIMIDPLISDHSEIYRAVLAALVQVSRRAGVSSAHLLFSRLPQVASLFSDEFQLRIDLQYHWYNRDYQDMDAFLSEFSSSKRKAIRKERRSVKETGVEIRNLRGHELGEKEIDSLFCFYLATKEKYPWGRAYLNRDFIAYLVKNTPESILATFAYQNGSENPIAGALSYLDKERLYGRYWGSTVEIPYLHFEVCYYAPIEFAIANGLRVFEPGAGGEHKLSRGFLPQLTASRHWIGDQRLAHAIKNFLTQERRAVVNYAESLSLPFSEISTGLESYRKSFQDDLILLGLR